MSSDYSLPRWWEGQGQGQLQTQMQLSTCSANLTVPTARWGLWCAATSKALCAHGFSGKQLQQLVITAVLRKRKPKTFMSPTRLEVLTWTSLILNFFYTCKWNKLEETSGTFTFRVSRGAVAEAAGGSHSCPVTEEIRSTAQAARGREACGPQHFLLGIVRVEAGQAVLCSPVPSSPDWLLIYKFCPKHILYSLTIITQ